jgi:glycosyltransferase involved in cell wall biosynthesis
MPRIVHVCPLYTPVIGGVEQCISRLSDLLAARGDDVEVWTTTSTSVQGLTRPGGVGLPAGDEVMPSGVRVRRHPVRYLPAQRYLLTAAHLLPLGEAWQANTLRWSPLVPSLRGDRSDRGPGRIDIVLGTPLPFTSLLHAAWQLAHRSGARLVAAPFTHLPASSRGRAMGADADRLRRIYLSDLNVRLLRRADLVLAQTVAERDALVDAGVPAERLLIGGAGVDPDTCSGGSRTRGRARWGLGDGAVVIGHLANKSWDKGTVDLIDAAEALWTRGVAFTLVLAGQEMPTFTRRWAAVTRFRDRIVNLGTLDAVEKRDFFASIDIFALPSYVESFGISPLEAAVNDVPTVAWRTGGPAELFTHERTALLPAAGDRDALASALQALIARPDERARIGRAARDVAAAHDWDASLRRVIGAYDALIAGGSR